MPVNSFDNYPMSWKPTLKNASKPLYLYLAKKLEYDIKNGTLKPNTKLPPQRELADYLDINLSTISRAFKICTLNGLLYGIVGKGTFVAPISSLPKLHKDTKYIDMQHLETFPQFNHYIKKALLSISDYPFWADLFSQHNTESRNIQSKAADIYLKSFKVPSDIKNIVLCPGSQSALATILISMFNAGDKIAVDKYTYHNFKILANRLRIQLIPIIMDEKGMCPTDLDKKCILYNIKGIYLMPVCHNPTAITIPKDRQQMLASIIRKNQLTVIEDAVNLFLAEQSTPTFYSFLPKQTFFVMGTSKAICSGIRLAILLYPHNYKEHIINTVKSLYLKTSSLDAEIFAELVNQGDAFRIIESKKRLLKKRNDLFHKYFKFQSPYENALSFYRWIKLSNKINELNFINECVKRNILVCAQDSFAVGIDNLKYLRICLSTPEKLDSLKIGLEMLKEIMTTE